MKTVTCKIMDAVNKLKGDIRNTESPSDDDKFLYASNDADYFICSSKKDIFIEVDFICDTEEFNDLVSQLETKFGESSLKHLHIWQQGLKRQPETDEQFKDKLNEMDKELKAMDIWKDAPEDATHYNPSDFVELCKYYKLSGKEYVYFYNGCWESSGASKKGLDECLIERPKPSQLVFTQAMADNGELPVVGMECCYSSLNRIVWNKCTIIAYYDGFVWTSDNGIRQLSLTAFKPIDTRTDKEKAIDNLMFFGDQGQDSDGANFNLEAIIAGKIHGVKWVGE